MSPQESHRRRVNITQKFAIVVVVVARRRRRRRWRRQALPTSKTSKDDRAQRERGVIIWLVNFYCARRASFLRGSLRRCHVRPCQPLLRATLISFFFFFYLSRPLSLLLFLSFSPSVAQIYIQRQEPTRHTRERRGARVSALSLLPLSKANLLCVFRGKSS